MLPFFIAGGGDSCVMSSSYVQDKGGWLADIDVDVTCSPGDSCEVEPVKMTDLRAGWNAVHVKLANLGGDDGCLWADAKITIKGSGIGFGINGSCTDMDGGNSPFAVGGAYGKIGPEVDETWVQDECLSENGLEFARDYTCVNGYIVPSTTLCDGGCDGGIGGGTCRRTAGHSCSPDSPSQNSGCFDGQVCLASKSSRGDCYDIVNPKTGSFKYDYTCDLGEKYSGELDETTCSDKGMAFLKEEFAGKEVNEGTLYDIDENTGVHCNTDIHGIANQYAIIWCSFWVG